MEKLSLHGSAKLGVSSYEGSADEDCCAGSIFSMKLSGFMTKAIKLLLTELVYSCTDLPFS